MGTRRECRERLVALFTANGSFTVVNGYAPLELNGASKVLNILSDSTTHEWLSANLNNHFYKFALDVYVKRKNGENSEDTLDDLHDVVRAVIRANIGDSTWNELFLDDESRALFAEVSGTHYRMERHTLTIKVTTS